MKKIMTGLLCTMLYCSSIGQDLLSLVDKNEPQKKEHVIHAFKSSRVLNGHSIEFIGKGELDVRILHRFGEINSGPNNLFGLDQANMRLGFDYGLLNSLTIGVGRSNSGKELDGFIKFRPVWQSTGPGSFPVSIVLVSGITAQTQPWSDTANKNYLSNRLAFYNEIIIGRKFSEHFSLQVSPVFVHRNLVALASDENDVYAIGIGARMKLSKRIALVADYHYIAKGLNKQVYKDPFSVGFDIETGGHVFQLLFTNATGMNEKAFITNTTSNWGKGSIRFGFNLSRIFTVGKKH
ncbi:hypothetical protein A4D02_27640 [Niastella koreensis]|uniref:DUF5777 domain-containing protein n=2 Tax=Niastella koreensis TaxID=354356 RepID=G8TI13_NIAKG|nr:DUF5777 family beta-barrel protein [Niastella koreensis]AEV99616.1 hypothetical protein Niako_3292 [Niastella koreensis GR20-10]OQP50204.1 hypothetical protein A4D02_27640 [Niastella koreensis]